MQLRQPAVDAVRLCESYVDGRWHRSESAEVIDVVDSGTETTFALAPACTRADVAQAVDAARRALTTWAATSVVERIEFLGRIRSGIEARATEFAETITFETGMPVELSRDYQVGLPLTSLAEASRVAATYEFEQGIGISRVVREPVGVVACITPWNYPLHQLVAKVAYALVAGCTVVAKPSELAAPYASILAEIIDRADLPAGVFNLVHGRGAVVGEALASHPDVDMTSFTGSTRAGRRVAELGSATIKRLSLELGGKSASVLLDDLSADDFAVAVASGVHNVLLNSGQSCSALTRMLVPASRIAEAADIARDLVAAALVGDPFALGVTVGPLASATQRDRVWAYIGQGIADGAELVIGGLGAPAGLARGYFVRPTVFTRVSPSMSIAQEEIFGPVLCVMGYADEDHAVEIANGVIYGLSGAVWSTHPERAERVARRLRTGHVAVNGAAADPAAPRGGYKQSGVGREFGRFGLEAFLETKTIQV